jgi:hypothetical protein
MNAALRSRDELNALDGLLLAAMADCDAPGAGEADRLELDRLMRYRAAVRDALRGVHAESWDPDTQAMADWLAGEGPNPLTEFGHSHGWQAAPEAPAAPGDWMSGVLALAAPTPRSGTAPAVYVPSHPVAPAPRRPGRLARPVHVHGHAVPGRDRIWLDVPFGDNELVKRSGGVWDPVARSWYAPRPGMGALDGWLRLGEVLPGEDRGFGQGLFVDLIPSTSWFRNVRSAVGKRDWFRIRQMVYRRAGQRCEACGAAPDKALRRFLECHERFSYYNQLDTPGLQMLRRLICLCSRCHEVTHMGHTTLGGEQAKQVALAHLMAVTGMHARQAGAHVDQAFHLWDQRSQRAWTVDLQLIRNMGIATSEPRKGDSAWAS